MNLLMLGPPAEAPFSPMLAASSSIRRRSRITLRTAVTAATGDQQKYTLAPKANTAPAVLLMAVRLPTTMARRSIFCIQRSVVTVLRRATAASIRLEPPCRRNQWLKVPEAAFGVVLDRGLWRTPSSLITRQQTDWVMPPG